MPFDQHFFSGFCANILAKKYKPEVLVQKAVHKTFVRKKNIGDIDPCALK
jgi:hypothetical protein